MANFFTFVILTALLAASDAAHIEKRSFNLFNSRRSGGLFGSADVESPAVPSGGYTNDALGVVVDAVAPGTRTSGVEPTGLGGPRTSYGSLNSKVGDAGFKTGGGAVKGTASGIGSLFGSGRDQGAHIGLPGIGFGSGSSTFDVAEKKTTSAHATVSKTTYESIHPTDENIGLGVGNAAIKGGAIKSGSDSSQSNLGLSGIGFGSGFRSLDASGIAATDAKVTGFGVSKTKYESIHSTDGNEGLGVGSAAVQADAIKSDSTFGFGSSKANLELPGIGFGSGSSTLDGASIEATDAKATDFGVSKTKYELIAGGDVTLGAEKAVVEEGAIKSGSIISSGPGKANEGLTGIDIGSGSSSLDASGNKATNAKFTGFGASKTTFESVHSSGGDTVQNEKKAAVQETITGSGSLFNSGLGQASAGLPSIGIGSGPSSLDASEIVAKDANVAGLGKSKNTYELKQSSGGDSAINIEKASVKGDSIGVGSIFGSGKKVNLGLPGSDAESESSSSGLPEITASDVKASSFDVSKDALNIEKAELKGGSIIDSVKGQVISEKKCSEAVKEYEGVKEQAPKYDTKAAFNTDRSAGGVSSVLGSSQKVNIGSLKSGEEYENNKIYAQKFSNEARINADGAISGPTNVFSGVSNVFGDSSKQKTNAGLTGVDFVSRISSSGSAKGSEHEKVHAQKFADNVGLNTHGDTSEVVSAFDSSKKINADFPSFGVGQELTSSKTVEGYEDDKIHAQKFDNKAALSAKTSATGIASDLGSSKKVVSGVSLGQGVISSKTVEGYGDDEIHVEKFTNNAELRAKGDASGISPVFETGSSQKSNVGVPNISALPGCGSLSTSGVKSSGEELSSFDVSKTSYSLIGSRIGEAAITTANAGLKVDAADVDALFGSSIGQKSKVELPGIDVLPGVSSSEAVTGGHENDKSHAQKFEVKSDISMNQHPIAVENLTAQKQNAKEEFVSHAYDGSYNVQNNNDKSDITKCNGEGNVKLPINSGDSGTIAVQGSIGNGQSLSSLGQTIENKFIGFGLNGQTDTQNKQVLLPDVSKIGVTGSYQTAGSYDANQESTFHNTQHFGVHTEKYGGSDVFNHGSSVSTATSTSSVEVPTPGQQETGFTKGNDEILSTFGSGITNAFNTGNFNVVEKKPKDFERGSYFLTSPLYPGYKVVDNRHKQSGYEGVKFSTNYFPSKAPIINFQSEHVPTENSFNLHLNTRIITPQERQQKDLTSSHYNILTPASVPSFPSTFPKLSTNFGQLPSNQGSFSSNRNQDSFPYKSNQKPLVQSQSNQKSSEYYCSQTKLGDTSGFELYEKPLTTGILTQTSTVSDKKSKETSIGSSNQNNQFGYPSSAIHSAKSETTHISSLSHSSISDAQTSYSKIKPVGFSQKTGLGISQTQFNSKFGSQSDLNSQKVVGSVFSTPSQNQQDSTKDVKQSGSQDSHKYLYRSQYSSTFGSQFGKKPESAGTIYHKFPLVSQKTEVTSQTSSSNEKPQFGLTSTSLTGQKSVIAHSSSSSDNVGSKAESVQSTLLGVKPVVSSQNTRFGVSQTQFGSTFGSQSDLKSQKVVGSVSSTPSQIQQDTQKDVKQSELQDSHKYSYQSQYSSTFGSQFGKKPESAGTVAHTFPVIGQKTSVTSQTSSSIEKPHFGFTSSSLTSQKSVTAHSSSSSNNAGSNTQSVQSSQIGVKPVVSSQNTGFGVSQTQFGSTFGSQSDLKSQKVVGSVSSTPSQNQQDTQKDVKQSGLQDSHKYSYQSQFSSTLGSQFGKKPESAGTFAHTFPVVGQKTSVTSQTSSSIEKPHFGFTSSSLTSQKSVTAHSSSSSNNAGSNTQSVQSSQIGVKPVVSSQNTGFGVSQTQFGSTFGSQSDLKSQKVVGSVSSTPSQNQQDTQKDVKQSGLQDSHKYSYQSQFSSTLGSQFGKKPESAGTFAHTFPVVGQKTSVTSQTSSSIEKPHFGFTSSSLTSQKSVTAHSSSSSNNAGSKAQSVQSSQLGVKPVVSSQNTGFGVSQTKFGSTFGSQIDLSSQKVVGSVFSTPSQNQQESQKDVKQSGLQDSHKYSYQSQFSSTLGSQFGKKPESAGTFAHTFPVVGQKTSVTSQTSSSIEKPHFGFTSSSLTSQKSVTAHSSSSSNNAGSKAQSVQSSQLGVKPVVSSQNTGFGVSQTQFGSTFGSQSDLKSQKVVGSVSSTPSQNQQDTQKGVKQSGSQDSHKYSYQSQFSSTFGSQFGKKPESAGTVAHTFPVVGQKTSVTSQTSSSIQKPHFGFTSSSLTSQKSVTAHSSSSSNNAGSKAQSVQSSQIGVKPVVSSQNTGFGVSQTQFGSTFGSQSGLKSQKVVGSVSSTPSQNQQESQKDVKQSGLQDSHKYSYQSQYSSTFGSQFSKKPESAGTVAHTFPVTDQKTSVTSQTSSSNEKSNFGFTSSSLTSQKSVTAHSSSSSNNAGSKAQSVQSSQLGVKPVVSLQNTGFGVSQTQFGSTFGSQSGLKSQKVVGSVSSTPSQNQQDTQKDVKQSGSQDSHKYSYQSQFSSTFGSQFGKKPESAGTVAHTFPVVGQKTSVTSQTSSSIQKPHFGFTSSSLTSQKSVTAHSSSSSNNAGSKAQSVQSSQLSIKPVVSSQNTRFGVSQTKFDSTFGSQSDLSSQKVVGSVFSTPSHNQQESQKDVKQLGLQDSHKYSYQSQYSPTFGSQFGKKPESAGTFAHTFPVTDQKTSVTSQTSSSIEKPHFGFTSSSLTSQKSVTAHSSSSSNNAGSKAQSVQSSQLGVKPVVTSQNTGFGVSQTQFGSTFGSQSGLKPQKVVGSVSSTPSQNQQDTQKDVKQSGSQDSHKYSYQSQFSSTFGSQFGKKPESAGTVVHTLPVVGQKTSVTSQTSSSIEKPHFGFTSSSLTSQKSVTAHSSSSSNNAGSNTQSVQSSQIGVKPVVSSQNTGFGVSQTQFGSTFGSQSDLKSQKVVGSVSSTPSQNQQDTQKDVKQSGLQDSHKYSYQSQFSSTLGSQFGKKPESAGTFAHTFPVVGQKTSVTSQTSSSIEKPHFGFTSSSLTSQKSVTAHSSSSSNNAGSNTQSVQSSQIGVKPVVSSQNTGFGVSQTQFGSTFGSQSDLKSQKVVGSVSSTPSQNQQDTQKDVKQSGLQDSHKYSYQPQFSSTLGSQFGKKPESAGTFAHTFPVVGQKTSVTSQTSSSIEKPHFGFTSSSLTSQKSVTAHSSSSSNNAGSKAQSVQSSQLGVKPVVSSQNTGFGVLQTKFGSTFGSQSDLSSQKVVGSVFSTPSQNQQESQKDVKQSELQDSHKYSYPSQYSSTFGSQFGKKPESAGTVAHTFPVIGQKTSVTSQTSSSIEKPHFGFTSTSLTSQKSVTAHSSSSSNNAGSKAQSIQSSQLGVKPVVFSQNTGFGVSQTKFGSTFGSQSDLSSQKVVGSVFSTPSQNQQESQKTVKQAGSQDSHKYSYQSLYSSTFGSQLGKKTESAGTVVHTFPVIRQKTTVASQKDAASDETQFGFSSKVSNSKKSLSTQSEPVKHDSASDGQTVQTSQIFLKPSGSSLGTGSSFTQTKFGSSFKTQSSSLPEDLSSSYSVLVQPISQYRKKPISSQLDQNIYHQSQYSSSTGTEIKPVTESSISHISSLVGQKSLETAQSGSGNENPQTSKSSSSLLIKKLQSTEGNAYSVSNVLKAQAEQIAKINLKPFVYPQTTGSSFFKTQFGGAFGSLGKQSFSRHDDSHQDSLLASVSGSQESFGQTHSVKPFSYSQTTSSGYQQPQLSFSLRDLLNHKPQSTFSKSFRQSYSSQGTSVEPFDSIQTPIVKYSGLGIGQNHGSSVSASANTGSFSRTQNSHVSKLQTTNFGTNGLQPFGGSLTQTVHKQTKVFGGTPPTDLLSAAHSIFDQSVSKIANTVPGAQIPISVTEKSSELSSFIGKGEIFGGPRDPPSFDIKTGYHY